MISKYPSSPSMQKNSTINLQKPTSRRRKQPRIQHVLSRGEGLVQATKSSNMQLGVSSGKQEVDAQAAGVEKDKLAVSVAENERDLARV